MPTTWIGPNARVVEVDDVVVGLDLWIFGEVVDALHGREDEVAAAALRIATHSASGFFSNAASRPAMASRDIRRSACAVS